MRSGRGAVRAFLEQARQPQLDLELRRRLSLVASIGLIAAILALGALQLAKDGSLYLDEASVARSLLELSPTDLLGRLVGGQSFPRIPLLAIAGLVELFGYQTPVLRALPHLFFVAGSLAWAFLLYERLRDSPALLLLAGLLLLIPSTWFVYGAMLKPYTLDVFLAMIPFVLRDTFFDETFGHRRRPLRALLLGLPCVLSYPYLGALLARGVGWWLARAAAGSARVAVPSVLALGAAAAVCLGCLWLTDLRHTAALREVLQSFWAGCILGAETTSTFALLDRFVIGWWDGRTEFARTSGLAMPLLVLLRLAFVTGLARVALSLRFPARDPNGLTWGSRSVACSLVVLGLPVASWLVGYPICSGRLTLFALLPVVLLILEGFSVFAGQLRRLPGGAWISRVAGCLLLVAVAPAVFASAAALRSAPSPEDLRPLLARTRERPELPILSTACTRRQLETLPEGTLAPVLYVGRRGTAEAVRLGRGELWLLAAPSSYCEGAIEKLRKKALDWQPIPDTGGAGQLWLVRLPAPRAAD